MPPIPQELIQTGTCTVLLAERLGDCSCTNFLVKNFHTVTMP